MRVCGTQRRQRCGKNSRRGCRVECDELIEAIKLPIRQCCVYVRLAITRLCKSSVIKFVITARRVDKKYNQRLLHYELMRQASKHEVAALGESEIREQRVRKWRCEAYQSDGLLAQMAGRTSK